MHQGQPKVSLPILMPSPRFVNRLARDRVVAGRAPCPRTSRQAAPRSARATRCFWPPPSASASGIRPFFSQRDRIHLTHSRPLSILRAVASSRRVMSSRGARNECALMPWRSLIADPNLAHPGVHHRARPCCRLDRSPRFRLSISPASGPPIPFAEGLDLQGGLQVVLQARPVAGQTLDSDTLEGTRQTLERRVNGLGVSEPFIQTRGNDQIIVELPGVDDPQEAFAILQQTALLEIIDPQGSTCPRERSSTPRSDPRTTHAGAEAPGHRPSRRPGRNSRRRNADRRMPAPQRAQSTKRSSAALISRLPMSPPATRASNRSSGSSCRATPRASSSSTPAAISASRCRSSSTSRSSLRRDQWRHFVAGHH